MNMKRIIQFLSASALLCICLALLTLSAAAEAEFEMEIPYGTPTVDGVIDEGEYEVSYVMDQTTATAWVGEVGDSFVTWHLAWDEGGLYYAGTINDSTPSWRGKDHYWVGIDCLELAINPGLLLSGNRAEGVFFSFGSAEDGSIVAWRHNFADGLVSDEITGANTGHIEGTEAYTMEVYIPWSLVQIKERCTVEGKEDIRLSAKSWKPQAGAQLGLLPCAIDSLDENGEDIIAYKFNGTDFIAKDFVVATLMAKDGETIEDETELLDTSVPESATDEPTTPDTDEPLEIVTENTTTFAGTQDAHDCTTPEPNTGGVTDAAQPTGCASMLSIGALTMLLTAAGVMIRKRKE